MWFSPKVMCVVYVSVYLCSADLDRGSSIEVIIDASDNAYGVFNFAPESLSVFGNENAEQSLVTLHVSTSILYSWKENLFFLSKKISN